MGIFTSKASLRLGIIASVLAIIWAIPQVFATYACIYSGKYCQFAIIGPDAQEVVATNRQEVVRRTKLAGAPSPATLRVQPVSGWWTSRVDVYADQAGEEKIIDSFRVYAPQITSGETENQFAIKSHWGNSSEIFLLRLGATYQRRQFRLECSYGEVSVKNLVLAATGNELNFDVESRCADILIDARFDIGVGVYDWRKSVYGDRIRMELDDQLLIRSVRSLDHDSEAQERRKENTASWDRAMTSLQDCRESKRKAAQKASMDICVHQEYGSTRIRHADHNSTWHYSVFSSQLSTAERLYRTCKGEAFDFSKSSNGQSLALVCFDDEIDIKTYAESGLIWQKPVGKSVTAELTGISSSDRKPLFVTELKCRCGAIDIRDFIFDPLTRTIEFDLKANASEIEIDGVVQRLNEGVAAAETPMGRSAEAHFHGRYRLAFDERYARSNLEKLPGAPIATGTVR